MLTAGVTPVSLLLLLKWTLSTGPKKELMETWGEMSSMNDARAAISAENDLVALTQITVWSEQEERKYMPIETNTCCQKKTKTRWRAHAAAADGGVEAAAGRLRWGTWEGGDECSDFCLICLNILPWVWQTMQPLSLYSFLFGLLLSDWDVVKITPGGSPAFSALIL